jgi:hypothetical protein
MTRWRQRKPKGRPIPKPLASWNATKSRIRARIEHVFAEQKDRTKFFIRTIGLARAKATVTRANMAFNMKRWCWLDGRSVLSTRKGQTPVHTARLFSANTAQWAGFPRCPGLGAVQ